MAVKIIVGKNDLLTVNPSLASEWDYVKNTGITPQMISAGSSKKMWWIGKCGHSWAATVASRNTGVGCPACAKSQLSEQVRKAAVKKRGSLAHNNPEVLKDWDYEKNCDITPEEIAPHSHMSVWWKCAVCSYEWNALIRNRVEGIGCPICYKKNKKSLRDKARIVKNPLSVCKPTVASEWHPLKNGTLTPDQVSVGSHSKVWWICSKGHEWEASPNHRTSKTRNCPYCCANPQVLPGENDLATLNPLLAKEWNYEKNGKLLPSQVTASSSKSVWWRCSLGHEWKTVVNHRNNGSGCPKCSRGRQTSFPEQAVFYYVSRMYSDAINGYTDIFRNHGMELDVFIPSLRIGIEYDGIAFHRKAKQNVVDQKKYERCQEAGVKLIRIREDVNNSNQQFCDGLILLSKGLEEGIKELKNYGVCVSDIDIQRDRARIDACFRNSLEENSLETKYPQIAYQWNYEKNNPLKPSMFAAKSNRIVWWKCHLGHEWKASIDSRVRGTGCPYCSNNKVLRGFNDLATTRPDLMLEWDYEKNEEVDPTTITSGSGKRAWWKCNKGHSWDAVISSRSKGHGCPYCTGYRKG